MKLQTKTNSARLAKTLSILAAMLLWVSMIGCGDDPIEHDDGGFMVEIDEAASTLEVEAPGLIIVEVSVENIGGVADTQDIEFLVESFIDGRIEDVELASGESTELTFEWQTQSRDVGIVPLEVRSDDDSDTVEATVDPASGDFRVTINHEESEFEVVKGETVIISAWVRNEGEFKASQDIEVVLNGSVAGSEDDFELEPDQRLAVGFEWDTEEVDAGSYSVEVRSDNDSDSATITIEESD